MTRRWNSRLAVRLGTLLFPLAGIALLWRSSNFSLARKIFGTIGILLFTPVWCAGLLLLLHASAGLEIEFRGGMVPRLTFSKTVPDYAALETHRTHQRSQVQSNAPRPTASHVSP